MNTISEEQEMVRQILRELGFSPRLIGYKVLCAAIPYYASNNVRCVTKELYPVLRKYFNYVRPTAIERPIRYSINNAWKCGDPEIWARYFPNAKKAPSNTAFIATLADHIT